ncbi:conserved protein of unknown function [Thermococcus nautili]|nr:conserved protein of unknown function [Thermococcus nautili]
MHPTDRTLSTKTIARITERTLLILTTYPEMASDFLTICVNKKV